MSLSPTSTQYLVGPLIYARNDIVLRTEEKTNKKHRKIGALILIRFSKKSEF